MVGRFTGSNIPDPGFPGDTGAADPVVEEALSRYRQDRDLPRVLHALTGTRVLVPVVAVLGEAEEDEHGLVHDKSSDMAAVLTTGRDGRQALLAFTGTETLRRWNPEARPVPVSISDAATAAVQEGAAALVLDLAGPVTVAIAGDDLQGMARGWRLARVDGRSAWVTG